MAPVAPLPESHLDQLAEVIGIFLTHREIEEYLPRYGFSVPDQGSKPRRVQAALLSKQREDRCANNVLCLVKDLVAPVRYVGRADLQQDFITRLNTILAFSGVEVTDDGILKRISPVNTVSEAEARAQSLHQKLSQRDVHPDVLAYCRAELLQNNYFHAVLEATKSVAEKIRRRTGLICDGENLIAAAFNISTPKLALNTLLTESEQSEQKGFANLLRGLFGTFRNPTAHAPRVTWQVSEQDALDLLTLVSYLHRRIDGARTIP